MMGVAGLSCPGLWFSKNADCEKSILSGCLSSRAALSLGQWSGFVPEGARDVLGFLCLPGSERVFAIDGQPRLAGIKKAFEEGVDLAGEQVPVILC